ncbi:carboxyl transferase domain-containing protein [Bradyrhizobium sp. WD16]|uniref:acetyl-CoA carboxylase family protein n=1 Tax=Bradyrhizobium sp. WD16 TaxID=1521768 RepID=UPI0020A3500D|nr:carboxyl transferase domain-containing protein [Bradyrhizobium sp. WD16]UTD27835.1 carbamoyl-phosphate synthase large subunit [Bradyrhizobium sp. WD16]
MRKPPFNRILIANRGEIAIRIARAAAELGCGSVAVFSTDDAASLHVHKADAAHPLGKSGAAAYLDIDGILAAARATGCDAIHPGYGFLSENAELAARAREAGIAFIGPSVAALRLFGDKVAARHLAAGAGVPVIEGTTGPTTLDEAEAFFAALKGGAMMIKAVSGGGGRGMRAVRDAGEIAEAFARCRSEAKAAFGDDAVYVERLVENARHIEFQVAGDRDGAVTHFGERECTLQRRNQKLVEIAPSPSLSEGLRNRIAAAALELAREARYESLGTFEFLVDADDGGEGAFFAFIEANPRLQVEHTVTEEVTGVDLVASQIALAAGASLDSLGFGKGYRAQPRGYAIQLRVNMETMDENGVATPSGGVLSIFEMPTGPGLRVDTFGYAGYRTSSAFDSLLAKLIVHASAPDYAVAAAKAYRAACEARIAGIETNLPFLQALLSHPEVAANQVNTRFVEEHAADLAARAAAAHPQLFASVDETRSGATAARAPAPAGTVGIAAPLQGTVVAVSVAEGDSVRPGQQLAVIEAMKMEHIITALQGGVVRGIAARPGMTLMKDDPVLFIEPAEVAVEGSSTEAVADLDAIRPDLAEMMARQGFTLDGNRPEAVARRRKTNQRTARENIAALVDEDSFIEYGSLAIAAQRARRSHDDLIRNTPADGLVAGLASVNGAEFAPDKARCMVVAYDYTVLAGTQGQRNHKKQDRMFRLAEELKTPVVLFAEGGGGRPGDTERLGVTGLDVPTFGQFAKLSGLVPLVGVVSGRCFAGNAALLGCCDVIIAARDSSIGMGGPAMIEGGGLGVYQPEEVGPSGVQASNGVIDVLVEDEIEAVAAAKQYLSYFQGPLAHWQAPDQRLLRRVIPENRLRVYEIRNVIETLADAGSVLELRRQFGIGIVTAFIRIEGQPFGLIASNPKHLGGAIDAEAGDKAAHFVQLCDAFDIPVVSLCDTPGFMVGPEAEKTALVRHVSRMFLTGASISVPYFTVVLRKGYGLGAQAMAGGGFHAQTFTISWPTGEFGGMGFEGAVRLGYRKEMEAIEDPVARDKFFCDMVAKFYETGKAINIASVLEIDQVIDPVDTRRWIMGGLRAWPKPPARTERKRPCIDAW